MQCSNQITLILCEMLRDIRHTNNYFNSCYLSGYRLCCETFNANISHYFFPLMSLKFCLNTASYNQTFCTIIFYVVVLAGKLCYAAYQRCESLNVGTKCLYDSKRRSMSIHCTSSFR